MALISRLQTLKSYHRIIFTLCGLQAIYNIAYYFLPGYQNSAALAVYRVLTTFSGIAVCMWTNFISCVNLYTIAYLQPFSILDWHRKAISITLTISIIFAVVFLLVSLIKDADQTMDYLYFYFRVISTLFNLVMFCVLYFIFNRPACALCIDTWFSHYDFTMRDMTQDLLAVLSTKLMYYPVVQIFSRVVSLWWEYKYGFKVTAFDEGHYSIRKAGAMILYSIFSPSAGVGYILTFFYVHPAARKEFFTMCREMYLRVCCCQCSSDLQLPAVAKDVADTISVHSSQSADSNSNSSSVNGKKLEIRATTLTTTSMMTNNNQSGRDSVSSTLAERDSAVQSNPVIPLHKHPKHVSAIHTDTDDAGATTNPLTKPMHDADLSQRVQSNDSMYNQGRFPLHPSATGFEKRTFTERWAIAPFAYDMEESIIWDEFFRRKLERESMTVHHDKP